MTKPQPIKATVDLGKWKDSSSKVLFFLSQEECDSLTKAGGLDNYVTQELITQKKDLVKKLEAMKVKKWGSNHGYNLALQDVIDLFNNSAKD